MIDVRFAFKPLIVFAAIFGFLTSGCATGHRIPEPPGVHPNEPHISWSIHAGTAENPEQLCQHLAHDVFSQHQPSTGGVPIAGVEPTSL